MSGTRPQMQQDLEALRSQLSALSKTLADQSDVVFDKLQQAQLADDNTDERAATLERMIRDGWMELGRSREVAEKQRSLRERAMLAEMKSHSEKIRYTQRQAQNLWRAYPRCVQALLSCIGHIITSEIHGNIFIAIGESGTAGVWANSKEDPMLKMLDILPVSIHELSCAIGLDHVFEQPKELNVRVRRRFLLCSKEGVGSVITISVVARGTTLELVSENVSVVRLYSESVVQCISCPGLDQIATLSQNGHIRCWSAETLEIVWDCPQSKNLPEDQKSRSICWETSNYQLYGISSSGQMFVCLLDPDFSGHEEKPADTETNVDSSNTKPLLSETANLFYRRAEMISNGFLPPDEDSADRKLCPRMVLRPIYQLKIEEQKVACNKSVLSELFEADEEDGPGDGRKESLFSEFVPFQIALYRSPKGTEAYVGCKGGQISIVQLRPHELSSIFHVHKQGIPESRQMSPMTQIWPLIAHKIIIGVHLDGMMQVWSIETKMLICLTSLPTKNPTIIAADAGFVVFCGEGSIFVYDFSPLIYWEQHNR